MDIKEKLGDLVSQDRIVSHKQSDLNANVQLTEAEDTVGSGKQILRENKEDVSNSLQDKNRVMSQAVKFLKKAVAQSMENRNLYDNVNGKTENTHEGEKQTLKSGEWNTSIVISQIRHSIEMHRAEHDDSSNEI